MLTIRHFDECESSGSTGFSIHDDVDRRYLSVLLKRGTKVIVGGIEREVPYINVRHKTNPKSIPPLKRLVSIIRQPVGKKTVQSDGCGERGGPKLPERVTECRGGVNITATGGLSFCGFSDSFSAARPWSPVPQHRGTDKSASRQTLRPHAIPRARRARPVIPAGERPSVEVQSQACR